MVGSEKGAWGVRVCVCGRFNFLSSLLSGRFMVTTWVDVVLLVWGCSALCCRMDVSSSSPVARIS